jgi:outer membrane protein OmpA-like peptidoglycan-associated protein/tetratricopeptide (TPR) repeat protein
MKNSLSLKNVIAAIAVVVLFSACSNALIKAGDKAVDNLSYSQAVEKYEKALNGQPDNIDLKMKLANAHRLQNNSIASEKYYQEVADSIGIPVEEQLHFAQVLMKNKKYQEAKGYLESYLKENPTDVLASDLLGSIDNISELKEDTSAYILSDLPLDFLVSMYGPSRYGNGIVVSGETEIISAKTANPWTGYSFLDMFYIEKDEDGNWEIPVQFGENLNGPFHDGSATFSKDQNMIIYTRSAMRNEKKRLLNEENENQFFLYTSTKEDGKWSEPEKLPFNSIDYSIGHPSLSEDGNSLYFSSDMPGGYGGSDLYKSTYDGSSWSQPVNVGSAINTPGNEVFPYVDKVGKLYFSSEGHRTLGGLDVFVSEQVAGVWSSPVNLAYPLNSSRDDFAILVNEDDSTGFVSSNRSGVDMVYAYQRIAATFVLKGIAKKKADNLPIEEVTITLINFTDGDTAIYTTDKTGSFRFSLLPEKKYKVIGEKAGFFTLTEEFATDRSRIEKDIILSFEIDEIVASEIGSGSGNPKDGSATAAKVYEIGGIYYDYDKSDISPSAQPALDKLAKLLKDNSSVKIEVHSHADSRGGDSYNMNLSNRRAQSVVNYLVKAGVAKANLSSKGFGEGQPVNKCIDGVECSEAEHQKNRRSEFIVVEKKDS